MLMMMMMIKKTVKMTKMMTTTMVMMAITFMIKIIDFIDVVVASCYYYYFLLLLMPITTLPYLNNIALPNLVHLGGVEEVEEAGEDLNVVVLHTHHTATLALQQQPSQRRAPRRQDHLVR
jgi:hypothetical protein